jgi:hypothetical protein
MKTIAMCALVLLLSSTAVSAQEGISISFDSEDSRTELGPRHDVGDARMAITSRDGSTVLLLTDDVVAMQLTDRALAQVDSKKKEKETNFLEELLVAGVRLAVGKSIEHPIENIRSIDHRDGALRVIGSDNKPVFTEVKVNGTDVLRAFSRADVTRFANAFRAAKAAR